MTAAETPAAVANLFGPTLDGDILGELVVASATDLAALAAGAAP